MISHIVKIDLSNNINIRNENNNHIIFTIIAIIKTSHMIDFK